MKGFYKFLMLGLITALPVFVHASGDSESADQDKMGLTTGNDYVLRVTSSGHITPGDSVRKADIGTPNHPYRATYLSRLNFGNPSTYISSAGITITQTTNTYIVVTSTEGPITITATPNVSTSTARAGDILIIRSSTASVILQDDAAGATGLKLGAATRLLGVDDIIGLIYNDGFWRELFFANN